MKPVGELPQQIIINPVEQSENIWVALLEFLKNADNQTNLAIIVVSICIVLCIYLIKVK